MSTITHPETQLSPYQRACRHLKKSDAYEEIVFLAFIKAINSDSRLYEEVRGEGRVALVARYGSVIKDDLYPLAVFTNRKETYSYGVAIEGSSDGSPAVQFISQQTRPQWRGLAPMNPWTINELQQRFTLTPNETYSLAHALDLSLYQQLELAQRLTTLAVEPLPIPGLRRARLLKQLDF